MRSRHAGFGLFVLLLACKPGPEATPPSSPGTALQDSFEWPHCETAACFTELAQEAREAGVADRAAALRGLAHAAEPSAETLAAWLDAQAEASMWRHFARTLAAHEREFPELTAELALQARPPGLDRPLTPGSPSPPILAALAAEAEGRFDDAILALAEAREPAALARLGDLLWGRGEQVLARAAWSAARVEIDERGGAIRMMAVEYASFERSLRLGADWIRVRQLRPLAWMHEHTIVSELQRWTADGQPTQSQYLPGQTSGASLSPDGARLVRVSEGDDLRVNEIATGRELARIERGDVANRFAVISGEHVLVAVGHAAELRSFAGEPLDRWELDHTVYGRPPWPVALALSEDLRWVAIAGSDKVTRLVDRTHGTIRELVHDHPLVELRFVDGGAGLWALEGHRGAIRWRTRDGSVDRHSEDVCADAELARLPAPTSCPELAPWPEHPRIGPSLTASLTADARYLRVEIDGHSIVWDLFANRDVSVSLGPDERAIALAPDGSRYTVVGSHGVELRRRDGTLERVEPDVETTIALFGEGRFAMITHPDRRTVLRDLARGTERDLGKIADLGRFYCASADGSRIGIYDGVHELRVYDSDSGEIVGYAFGRFVAAALGHDGAWVVALEHRSRGRREADTLVHYQPLGADAQPRVTVTLNGAPKHVAAAPEGVEVLISTDSLPVRWRPQAEQLEILEGLHHLELDYVAAGRLLAATGFGVIELRENQPGLPLFALIHPLDGGGWIVTSASGAVDGSPSARDHALTMVRGFDGEELIHAGSLGWDRFAVDGLLACLLAPQPAGSKQLTALSCPPVMSE